MEIEGGAPNDDNTERPLSDSTEELWEEIDVPVVNNRVPLDFIKWSIDHTVHMGFDFSPDMHVHVRYIKKDDVAPPSYSKSPEISFPDDGVSLSNDVVTPLSNDIGSSLSNDIELENLLKKLKRKVIKMPDRKIGEWE